MINGYNMLLTISKDAGISKDLYIHKIREPSITKFLPLIIKKGDVVCDIGANIGYYALQESRLVDNSGLVYAIEPVEVNRKILQQNIKLNNLNNIQVFPFAIGDIDTKSYINISKNWNWHAMRYDKDLLKHYTKQPVKQLKLDTFLEDKKHPNLIRMDVEGYECKIIEGMLQTLQGDIALLIELHPFLMTNTEINGMIKSLKQAGYTKALTIKEQIPWWINPKGLQKIFIIRTANWETMELTDLDTLLLDERPLVHVYLKKEGGDTR